MPHSHLQTKSWPRCAQRWKKLLPLYAAAVALSDATKTRVNGVDRMRDAISAARGMHGLLGNQRSIDVPVDLIKALWPLSEKGAAMGDARFLQSVGLP
tara:strand:+ start:879 stop:1172 length:294 start_codon:yes stop_codon:yes gene_type:complete